MHEWFEPVKAIFKEHPHLKGRLHLIERDVQAAFDKNSQVTKEWDIDDKTLYAVAYTAGVAGALNPYSHFNGMGFDGHSVSTHPQ
jgi:hypothetical protein